MAFQSTKCILDTHVFFEQVSELERAERDVPDDTFQELLGHDDVSTTTIYTHALNRGGRGVYGQAGRLGKRSVGTIYCGLISGYTARSAAFVGPTGPNTGVLSVGNRGSGLFLVVGVALRNRLQEPAQ